MEFDKDKLIFLMDNVLKEYIPANTFSYSQPIELRVAELIAGVRSDVGIALVRPGPGSAQALGMKSSVR